MAEAKAKVGGRMRELREERKLSDPRWTQDYFARLVHPDLTGTQISRYERGEITPLADRLERIAEILDTTVADLYAGPMADREPPRKGNLSELDVQAQIVSGLATLTAEVSGLRTALERLLSRLEPGEDDQAGEEH